MLERYYHRKISESEVDKLVRVASIARLIFNEDEEEEVIMLMTIH